MTTLNDRPEDQEAVAQLTEDFLNQSADFVWLEICESGLLRSLPEHSKFKHMLRRAERELPRPGFDWISPPEPLRSAINLVRRAVQKSGRSDEQRALVWSALTEADPSALRTLRFD